MFNLINIPYSKPYNCLHKYHVMFCIDQKYDHKGLKIENATVAVSVFITNINLTNEIIIIIMFTR